ncbi:NTP transferase domain-containing protein [Thiocystis minor]|uniref:NTP transferase domain-containing protein n=1 Tax=Thiocystis minor TaxID=61597 RepID=UPI001912BA66
MSPDPVAGLILAAGRSSRMGSPKALLRFDGLTALEQNVARMRLAGIDDIRVVIGHDAERIRSAHPDLPVRWIENPQPERGMLSSILTGVAQLRRDEVAMLLQPVDIPLVSPKSLAALLDQWRRQQAPVIYPVFKHRRGHPPLIALDSVPFGTHWDQPGGLRVCLHRFDPDRSIEIDVEDPAILVDYDTPADYLAGLRID